MFELDLHIIKTNILIKIQVENVAASVNKISIHFDLVT